jgi:hypothetical protein
MANAFRNYLPKYATLVQRLESMTSKHARFAWGAAEQEDFDRVKTALISPPVLQLPRTDMPFVLAADGSSFCAGAILMQDHSDSRHPVGCFSKRLVGPQLTTTPPRKKSSWQW